MAPASYKGCSEAGNQHVLSMFWLSPQADTLLSGPSTIPTYIHNIARWQHMIRLLEVWPLMHAMHGGITEADSLLLFKQLS